MVFRHTWAIAASDAAHPAIPGRHVSCRFSALATPDSTQQKPDGHHDDDWRRSPERSAPATRDLCGGGSNGLGCVVGFEGRWFYLAKGTLADAGYGKINQPCPESYSFNTDPAGCVGFLAARARDQSVGSSFRRLDRARCGLSEDAEPWCACIGLHCATNHR